MSIKKNSVIQLLEQLRKSVAIGQRYANNEYDKSRYEELNKIAEELYSHSLKFDINNLDPLDTKGYITPKVGVNAIIENEKGEILLEKRVDDHCWGIPGGWAEVNYSPEENLIREVKEETGLDVKIERLVGVMSRRPSSTFAFTSYHILYKCSIISGEIMKSHESEDVAWKNISEMKGWHFDHKEWVAFYLNSKY